MASSAFEFENNTRLWYFHITLTGWLQEQYGINPVHRDMEEDIHPEILYMLPPDIANNLSAVHIMIAVVGDVHVVGLTVPSALSEYFNKVVYVHAPTEAELVAIKLMESEFRL